MRTRLIGALLVLVLASACGGGGESDPAAGDDHAHEHDHGDSGDAAALSFGEPGSAADASQTLEIVAADPYEFDPEDIAVEPGETVTFEVTNEGDQVHEFVLGDRAYQDSHEEEMAAGSMHHDGNAVTVAPGDTEELTWTFPSDGSVSELYYGCHEPGHYDGGMVGTIRIGA